MASLTEEQLVAHVLRNRNDYYSMLGLDRGCTEAQLKTTYKKLALRLHPDKCSHPKAAEAFKALSTANTTLSDSAKRLVYDNHGAEGVMRHESTGDPRAYHQQRRQHHQHPDDIFEEFVHSMFGGARAGGRRQQFNGGIEINPQLLLILPLLLFFLFASLLSSNFFDGSGGYSRTIAPYSLVANPNEGLVKQRVTNMYEFPDLRVTYFVGNSFETQVRQGYVDLRRTELAVLREQRDSLQRRCRADQLRKQARNSIQHSSSEVCDEYRRFRRVP